jgi:GT2 family glycosyltransferase
LQRAGRVGEDLGVQAAWVVLTMGNRPVQLRRAVESIGAQASGAEIVIVANGVDSARLDVDDLRVRVVASDENLGVPGGRDLGLRSTTADIVFFLDDDAEVVSADLQDRALAQFAADPMTGALSFRIVDESGRTTRRHVPRIGARSADTSGPVVNFLGGACALRRSAYIEAGGYWSTLRYGHEELELSWRLIDRGWSVRYLADAEVFHPATVIGRHEFGWQLTGRNRVLIARRNLPWPVAILHLVSWSALGVLRAPDARCRRAYLAGFVEGLRTRVERRPLAWTTIWRLARLGRPPIV